MGRYASESLTALAEIVRSGYTQVANKDQQRQDIDRSIKTAIQERYQRMLPSEGHDAGSTNRFATRVAYMSEDNAVPFAGIIHPENPSSGVYGGMSLIWFPISGNDSEPASSLLTFVCGTRGLSPDEQILGRPGHSRLLQALRRVLADSDVFCWVKQDPTNLSQQVPNVITGGFSKYQKVFERYGNYIYAAVEVPQEAGKAALVVGAFLDYYARERGWIVKAAARPEFDQLEDDLRAQLFPRASELKVLDLLRERRFVILQGPPGTGKTRLAKCILDDRYSRNGAAIQFHPALTYESFVAGISPEVTSSSLAFSVKPGFLAIAIKDAQAKPELDFLLMIDEINRADLSRILGEAIFLFEPGDLSRKVTLSQQLPDGTSQLSMPANLYILGTMNSADRSIAILDLAVRRRFAFVDVWPDASVIQCNCENQPELGDLPSKAFGELQDIFADYAPDDALVLLPGHSYFLAASRREFENRMKYDLMPLIQEYLLEGRLGACETELRAYLVWLEGELAHYAAS